MSLEPGYITLFRSGELLRRVREGYRRLASCDLCPHNCGVNRINGQIGFCRSGVMPRIASANLHHGEEPPISGSRGSGAIFFSGCSMRCLFCQNFPISQQGNGQNVTTRQLAGKMLQLQKRGAHNINLVTPTHWLPQILAALYLAAADGLRLPLLWNSSGYERLDALQLLDGLVDIYLPDMKYADDRVGEELSGVVRYSSFNRSTLQEMLRQVGHLQLDDDGIAIKGLIIRHLVLPNGRAGSADTLHWIAENLGQKSNIALMSQYFPAHRAEEAVDINRPVNHHEYDAALEQLELARLDNGWVQDLDQERGAV